MSPASERGPDGSGRPCPAEPPNQRSPSRDTGAMGLNPFRQQRRRSADYVYVAASVIVVVALVLWALLPR